MDKRPVLLRGNGNFTPEQYAEVLRADNEKHLMLSLALTTAPGCNMRCIFCYSDGGTKEAGRDIKGGMTPADYEKAIREAAEMGAQSVIIVGVGETMLDKNFPDIIELCGRHGLYPLVFTNGTLLDKDTVRFLLKNKTTVYLSLNSTRENVYNQITRSRGLFPRVMWGIDNCLEEGFGRVTRRNGHRVTDFGVNTMVMKANIDHLDEIKHFCEEKGILFTCRLPEKLGTARDGWANHIAATPAEEAVLREKVAGFYAGGEVFRTDHGCLFWVAGVLLGVDGRARLCYSLNNKKDFGNIKTDSLRDIILKKNQIYPATGEYFCPLHQELELAPS